MIKIQTITPAGLTLMSLTALFAGHMNTASAEEKPALGRTVLLENKVELPSKNINARTIRVTFPPASKTPEHTHEGPGPRYVTKGRLKVIEGGKTHIYSAGDVFWESGELMSVENVGKVPAEVIIFEMVPTE
ncbi:cupin domain-containing protein [Methylobacter sp. BlB1]|uniref:cupin domain-containing protein n=1 Tax=unclassified Methylobacter TaxID=2635283 RepID=UPI0018960F66|nr:cupin domain-containing protein [Methylobacter sp. BlB1]MBF6647948.1 cupin domain-containing protein [Methylobacter sp. BlB1]